MRPITMIVVAALAVLLVNVPLSQSCDGEGPVLICQNTPFDFSPGFSTLVILLQDIGEINATVFRSSNLASVTRLKIDSAGVTGIADGAFGSLQNLTSVSLRRNELTQMNSNWFGRPALLREISLEENQIEVLSESTLTGLTGLTKLSLRMNRIRTIESNSFLSQTNLSELDLSGNRLTRVSPQVFRTLGSTRIRLDGNPWDCSCAAEEFVLYIQDLQNRSLLDRPMDVTCETPPTLRGRPVWNVLECVTSPSSEPPSASPSADLRPTDTPPTVPATSEVVTALPQTTFIQNRSTDAPTTVSAHTATDPTQPTSARPLSTDESATQTTTHVTAPPSETESLTPPPTGVTETCVTSNSDTNTVCTLVIVIVVLCVLLFVVCFLVLRHRRRRNNKTVMPGRPEEEQEQDEVKEVENDNSRSNLDPSPEESRDPEGTGWRPFAGVRAKSAGAILFMSPSCVSVKDQVALQHETEAQSSDREAADGEQKVENEAGGIQTENLTNSPDTTQRRTDTGGSLDDNSHCVSVSTDTVAYLSIGGTSINKPNPDNLTKQPTDSSRCQRSQMGKVIGRISTWPPTAVQWQARCKTMQEMEEEEEGKETEETGTNKQEPPSFCTHEDEKVENQMEDVTFPNKEKKEINTHGMKLKFSEVQAQRNTKKEEDQAKVAQTGSGNQTVNKEKRNQRQQGVKSVEKPAQNSRSTKRDEASRPDNTGSGSGSRARSSGASPDDETLLRGNEYAFMDLLHEVAQNNGRWTRERWRQVHVNKQRR